MKKDSLKKNYVMNEGTQKTSERTKPSLWKRYDANMFKHIVITILMLMCLTGVLFAQAGTTQPQKPPGTGTSAEPYLISTLSHLRWVSERSNEWWVNNTTAVYFKQTADINANETRLWNSNSGFRPIGYPTTLGGTIGHYFVGEYDGQHFSISNLFSSNGAITNSPKSRSTGLFSSVFNGSIKNLRMINTEVFANLEEDYANGEYNVHAGAIAARIMNTEIIDCSSNGGVVKITLRLPGSWPSNSPHVTSNAGGIVGSAINNSTIRFSYSTANVSSDVWGNSFGWRNSKSGGIAGAVDNSKIFDSFSRGSVTSTSQGANANNRRAWAGGITGRAENNAEIRNSYATGNINAHSGSENQFGGVVGYTSNMNNINIANNLWNGLTTQRAVGNIPSNGTNVIMSDSNMKNGDYSGWNFCTIWIVHSALNDSYPTFRRYFAPPANITIEPTMNGLSLTWGLPETVIGSIVNYTIFRRTGTENFQNIHTTTSAETSERHFTDSGVNLGTAYSYYITASFSSPNRNSINSNTVSRTINLSAPIIYQGILTEDHIEISWNESIESPGEISYEVYRKIGTDSNAQFSVLSTNITTTSFNDINIDLLEEHYLLTYYVVAVSGIFKSNPSNPIEVTLSEVKTPAPSGLSFEISSDGEMVTLSWLAPAGQITGVLSGYKIYRDDINIGIVSAAGLSYVDSTILPFGEYLYEVSATYVIPDPENPDRESMRSLPVLVKISDIVDNVEDARAPIFVRAYRVPGGIEISWDKPIHDNPDGYTVYRISSLDGTETVLSSNISHHGRKYIDSSLFAPGERYRLYGVQARYSGTIGGERTSGSQYSETLSEDRTVTTSHGVQVGIAVTTGAEAEIGIKGFGSVTVKQEVTASVGHSFEYSESSTIGNAVTNEVNQSQSFSWSNENQNSAQIWTVIVNNEFNEPRNLHFVPTAYGVYSGTVYLTWSMPIDAGNNLKYYQIYRDGVMIRRINASNVPTPGEPDGRAEDNLQSSLLIIGLDYHYYVTAIYDIGSGLERESKPSNIINAYTTGGLKPNGAGTEENPYEIWTLDHLRWISEFAQDRQHEGAEWGWVAPNAPETYIFIKQMTDIDAAATQTWHGHGTDTGWIYRGFRPIGYSPNRSHSSLRFRGVYDGQGFSISNLYINADDYALFPVGLFSSVEGRFSVIKNLNLVNANIKGGSIVGGLVGELAFGARIENCSVNGYIYGYESVGGLVGFAANLSSIHNSFSTGEVIGSIAGGLIGTLRSSFIHNSYSTADIYGGYIGGLTGTMLNSSIYNSYFIGNVENNVDGSGGLLSGVAFMLENVQDTNFTPNIISNSFWINSSEMNGFGEISRPHLALTSLGKTPVELRTLNTYLEAGWDFSTIWGIHENVNNGYPFLQMLTPAAPVNLTAEQQINTISLSWDTITEGYIGTVVGYNLFRDNVLLNSTPIAHNPNIPVHTYIDDEIENAMSYYYYVTALYTNPDRESMPSNQAVANIYNPPTNLTAESINHCSVVISWTDPDIQNRVVNNSTLRRMQRTETINRNGSRLLSGYIVYRDDIEIGQTTETVFTDIFDSLAGDHPSCGNTYTYHVVSVHTDPDWVSVPSNSLEVIMPEEHLFHPAGTLSYSINNNGHIILNWSEPETSICGSLYGYKVFRNDVEIGDTDITYYTDNNPATGENHYFVRAIYVEHNGVSINSNTVSIYPGFYIDHSSYDFDNTIIGETSVQQTFTITNIGESPFVIESISNDNTENFTLVAVDLPYTIGIVDEYTFTVKFSPVIEGSKTANLSISHNADGSPQIVVLSGTGLGLPNLEITPFSHSFGNVLVGETSDVQSFTLKNTGGSSLVIDSIEILGLNADDFDLIDEDNIMGVYAANESKSFSVVFVPESIGAKSAYIEIVDNVMRGGLEMSLSPAPDMNVGRNQNRLLRENIQGSELANRTNRTTKENRAINTIALSGAGYAFSSPTNLQTNIITNGINLTWEAPPAQDVVVVTGYRIIRNGETLTTVTTTNHLDTTVSYDTTYAYGIVAIYANPAGESSVVNTTPITTPNSLPVTGLQANLNAGAVSLTWTPPVPTLGTITGYRIIRNEQVLTIVNTAEYLDTAVSPNSSYTYGVVVLYANPNGESSLVSTSINISGFAQPRNLQANLVINGINLTWEDPISDIGTITGYRITRNGETLATVTTTTYLDTSISYNTTYVYGIVAIYANPAGESNIINASAVTTPNTMPVTGLEAGFDDEAVNLIWTAPVPTLGTITGYRIIRNEQVLTIVNTTEYLDMAISPNTSYTYGVVALYANPSGESSLVSTSINTSGFAPPRNLQANLVINGINLTWEDPISDIAITGYRIVKNGETLITVPMITKNYLDIGISYDTTYAYGIVAIYTNPAGESSVVNATPITTPNALPVTGLEADLDAGVVNLIWTAPEPTLGTINRYGYRIVRNDVTLATIIETNYTDNGVISDTQYTYGVVVIYNSPAGESTIVNATPIIIPVFTPITGLQANVVSGAVNLTWTAPVVQNYGTVLNYRIFKDGVFLANTTNTNHTDNAVSIDSEYSYNVIAVYGGDISGDSIEVSVTIIVPAFTPVTDLQASLEGNIANLTWTAPVAQTHGIVTGYKIMRNESLITTITNTNYAGVLPLVDTEYKFGVIAVYSNPNGESKTVETAVLILPVYNPPIRLTAEAGNAIVTLTWEAPESQNFGTHIGYRVYRDGTPLPANINAVALAFTDHTVINETEYTYHITALYEVPDGESEASNSVTVTPRIVSEIDENILPLKTELADNYPNPFNPETTINFALSEYGNVRIDIFNIRGNLINTIVNGDLTAGNHSVVWKGVDERGRQVASGIYFYKMQTNDFVAVKRMLLMK